MSESLIIAVQDHEMLYAPSHREYKNAKKKLLVWDMIGESLNMTGRWNGEKYVVLV